MSFEELSVKKNQLESVLPFPPDVLDGLRRELDLEVASVGICFDGGSLTRRETELVLFQDKVVPDHSLKEHIQVLNMSNAFRMIFEQTLQHTARPFDENDIKNLHRVIVRELDDANGGMYRGFSMTFPFGDLDLPEPVAVHRKMDEIGMWLFSVRTLHPVAVAADVHLRLMAVHPFAMGNGAVARMMMNMILMRSGYPPILFSRREKNEYWQTLKAAVYDNDRSGYDKLVYRAVNRGLDLYLKSGRMKKVEIANTEPYFLRIGQLAKETGERVSTLRYWTSLGILSPVGKTSADYMIFSSDVLETVRRLKELKEKRLTLEEIKRELNS